jgi:hypothetical protein
MKAHRFAVLAVVGAVATGVVLSTSSTAQTPGARTFVLSELTRSATFRFIDNPPKAFNNGRGSVSAGDIATVRTPLVDASKHRAGTLNAACTVTKPAKTFATAVLQCNVGFELQGGQLAATGAVRGETRSTVLAITGGTGANEGARGSVTAVAGRTESQDTFHLLP